MVTYLHVIGSFNVLRGNYVSRIKLESDSNYVIDNACQSSIADTGVGNFKPNSATVHGTSVR